MHSIEQDKISVLRVGELLNKLREAQVISGALWEQSKRKDRIETLRLSNLKAEWVNLHWWELEQSERESVVRAVASHGKAILGHTGSIVYMHSDGGEF